MSEAEVLGPVRQIPAHELVLDQIRRSMEIGQFRPGDRLPAERELADILDVSRTTVRAAVAVLERDGLISVRRGRGGGFLVLEPTYDLVETRHRLRRDKVAMRDAFDYRVIVEGGAARLAAERRRVADLRKLAELVSRMGTTIDDSRDNNSRQFVNEFHVLDTSFHLGIAKASRNEHLVDAVAEGRRKMFLPMGAIFGRIEDDANDDHAEILTALRDKDADQAVALMSAHINRTKETFEAWLGR